MGELRHAARSAYGDGLIDLSRSEPLPVPLPDECAAVVQREFQRARGYGPPGGLPATRDAVAGYVGGAIGRDVSPDDVAITTGAIQGVAIALAALIEPGAEVLVPRPYFHAHPRQVRLLGATPRLIDTRATGGLLTPEAVEAALTTRTRALLLCNPVNPSGTIHRRDRLEQLLEALPRDVAVISDEVYGEYFYEGAFTSILEVAAREDAGRELVAIQTASKTAGMPGWRVGAAVTSPGLAPRLARAAAMLSGAPSTPGQLAYAAWLFDPPAFDRMAPYRTRVNDAIHLLDQMELDVKRPRGTYYVWAQQDAPGVPGRIGTADRVLEIALRAGVLVWPGEQFGHGDHVRISLSVPRATLREGLERLRDGWRETGER